jgi:hypothetical protein
MIVSTSLPVSSESLAAALAKGVKYAKADGWVASVKALAMQVRAIDLATPYADAACIAAPFLFRVTESEDFVNPAIVPGNVHHLDNAKLAKGVAKLAAAYPDSYGRIATDKAQVNDCLTLLQLALYGYEKH